MMQSEFTELTKIHVDPWMYEEIEKRYMASELTKQEFCKMYKANKDGIQESVARETGLNIHKEISVKEAHWKQMHNNQAIAKHNAEQRVAELEETVDKANRMVEQWSEDVRSKQVAIDGLNKRVDEMEETLKAKDQEIMMLKAKLYDMMMKGVA